MAEENGVVKGLDATPSGAGRRLLIVAFLLAAALAVYQMASAYCAPPAPVPAEAEP